MKSVKNKRYGQEGFTKKGHGEKTRNRKEEYIREEKMEMSKKKKKKKNKKKTDCSMRRGQTRKKVK